MIVDQGRDDDRCRTVQSRACKGSAGQSGTGQDRAKRRADRKR